jgi:hypothetical protein
MSHRYVLFFNNNNGNNMIHSLFKEGMFNFYRGPP